MLLPGIVLIAIAERSGSDSLERAIGRELARESEHTAERLSSVLRTERQTLASFARQDLMREIRVADIDKRISQALVTLRDGSPLRTGYWVVDRTGQVVAASEPARLGTPPAWAARLLPEPGAVAHHLAGARLLMAAAIADPDDAGRVLGTLVTVLDWGRITKLAGDVQRELARLGLESDVLICQRDGTVLGGAHTERSAEPSGWLPEVLSGARERSGWLVHAEADRIVGRAALAADLPAPFSDWTLLVVESRTAALAPARALSKRLLATMGLALVLALGLATVGARRVVQPLTELTHAIRSLAHDADARQVPVRSDDELGRLGEAFNRMAGDLHQAQHDLVEAEKFAFVGELAAGVAHEIRTSLGVLRSSAQLLRQSLPSDANAETAELAEMLGAEVTRLGGVVDDLLTLHRHDPLRLEPTAVSEPILRAIDFVLPKAREKGIEVSFEEPAEEARVRCEPELVQQVAVNLLVNAIQAIDAGGHVQVGILPPREGFGGFHISDDGPGIPPELRERIFQPFVTARPGGVGLGLTFVKRVIHDHRGRVRLEPTPRGARFEVELLLAADEESEA